MFLLLYYSGGPNPEVATRIALAHEACQGLITTGCNVSSNTIKVNFDANKDGKIDSSDTLFELCKNYYDSETDADCKAICSCPGY